MAFSKHVVDRLAARGERRSAARGRSPADRVDVNFTSKPGAAVNVVPPSKRPGITPAHGVLPSTSRTFDPERRVQLIGVTAKVVVDRDAILIDDLEEARRGGRPFGSVGAQRDLVARLHLEVDRRGFGAPISTLWTAGRSLLLQDDRAGPAGTSSIVMTPCSSLAGYLDRKTISRSGPR